MKRLMLILTVGTAATVHLKADTNFVGNVHAQYGNFYATYGVYGLGGEVYAGTNYRMGGSTATGVNAAAFGVAAVSTSYSAIAIGRYNKDKASDGVSVTPGNWVDKDPLFVVGNGNGTAGDPNQYRNALAVYKDGTITMSRPQGDISMGQFQ